MRWWGLIEAKRIWNVLWGKGRQIMRIQWNGTIRYSKLWNRTTCCCSEPFRAESSPKHGQHTTSKPLINQSHEDGSFALKSGEIWVNPPKQKTTKNTHKKVSRCFQKWGCPQIIIQVDHDWLLFPSPWPAHPGGHRVSCARWVPWRKKGSVPKYIRRYLFVYVIVYCNSNVILYHCISLYIIAYHCISCHIYLSIHLPTYLPIYLSTYLPIYLSTYLPIYLPTYLPIYLSTYTPIQTNERKHI